jgi:hypothetical protein
MPFSDYKSQRRDAHRRGGGYGKNGTHGGENEHKRTNQNSKFFPLFLLKETEAFVPHDHEAQTREQRPSSGFIKAEEGHRERRRTTGKNEKRDREQR